jgi:hypothetical protein
MNWIDLLASLRGGVWHFTDRWGLASIVDCGHIRPSDIANGDFYAAQIGAVALFDLSNRPYQEVEPNYVEIQVTNIIGFLGRFTTEAFAIRLKDEVRQDLLGPSYLGGFTVPVIEDGARRFQPLHVPYFERWHVGPITIERVRSIRFWQVEDRVWKLVSDFASSSEALHWK